jgi:hypothetical protein
LTFLNASSAANPKRTPSQTRDAIETRFSSASLAFTEAFREVIGAEGVLLYNLGYGERN